MKGIKIYLKGVLILIGAILINLGAKYFGILTWYDFLKIGFRNLNILDYIFLFLFYPLSLGLIAYLSNKAIKEKL